MSSFWDASAAIALCAHQSRNSPLRRLLRENSPLVVWWGTPIEIRQVLVQAARDRTISRSGLDQGLARLSVLRRYWHEVLPSDRLREMAEGLLDAHALRLEHALQLSAALVWSDVPRGRRFVCADPQLARAAAHLRFTVVRADGMRGAEAQAAGQRGASPEEDAWENPLMIF